MATQSLELLRILTEAGIDFVVVGGIAATFHGTTIVTDDLDVCVRFNLETCQRILAALANLDPRHRMRADRLPLSTDPASFVGYRNLYVASKLGVIDFLGEVAGVGGFDEVKAGSVIGEVGAVSVRFMSLDHLLASKRAMGRPKDHRVLIELEVIHGKRRP